MELYIIQLEIGRKVIYIYPFRFLRNWKRSLIRKLNEWAIKRYLWKQNWTKEYINKETLYCNNLDNAIKHMSSISLQKLKKNKPKYLSFTSKLIENNFDQLWPEQ